MSARTIDGVSFDGSTAITHYGTCPTAAGDAAKTASITAGTFSLTTGARVTVKFTKANSVANPTLNVGNTDAKAIYWHGSALPSSQYWQAGAVLDFVYNGTQWELVGVAKDNNTTYSEATTSAAGLMSTADKTKLNNIAAGAEVNQNAFSNIVVGSTTIAADAKTDTLTLVAGSNVTITSDATNDKVTIAAKDTTYSAATTSAAGLMSASDKSKLDGIATNANAYSLPTASSSTLGGVKIGSNINISSGKISVPIATGASEGVTKVYPAASCTTFSSDSGTVTPLAVQKGAKMFAITRPQKKTSNDPYPGTGTAGTTTDKNIVRWEGTDGNVQDSTITIEDVTNSRDGSAAQVIAIPASGGKKMVYGYCTDQIDGTSFIGGVFDASATSYPYNGGLAIGGTSGNLLWKGNKVIDASNISSYANKTTVDSALSSTSTNPVQNKVINAALAGKADNSALNSYVKLSGNSNIAGSLLPYLNGTYSLGTSSLKWNTIYASTINPNSIEFSGSTSHGGYIDFHYGSSTADNTSRIIESASGVIDIVAPNGIKFNSGALSVANGGTGATTLTSGRALIGAGTGAVTTRAITNNTATSSAITGSTNLVTMNTLKNAINRTTSVAAANTNYTTLMARGSSLNATETTPTVNGAIAWTYE